MRSFAYAQDDRTCEDFSSDCHAACRAAEERRQVGEVFVDGGLQPGLAVGRLDELGGEILAELGVEALLRHGGAREVAQRVEGAMQQVLDLQDLGEIGQKFYGDELLP